MIDIFFYSNEKKNIELIKIENININVHSKQNVNFQHYGT